MADVTPQTLQLDTDTRQALESVVTEVRREVLKKVTYWVESYLGLETPGTPAPSHLSQRERTLRTRVHTAIQREQASGKRSYDVARTLYIKSVGYTFVNRVAALRCMETRGLIDRSQLVTQFRGEPGDESRRSPAAHPLIENQFLHVREGVWVAFLQACHQQSEDVQLLFDLSTPYSVLWGDVASWDGTIPEEDLDTALHWSKTLYEEHAELLMFISDRLNTLNSDIWNADDVLGWIYEYYNVPELDDIRRKARGKGLDPEDVTTANQFYTPHWVVRMLTDNSLGKLYLEHTGTLHDVVQWQRDHLSVEERQFRDPDEAASLRELCTYLVPSDEHGASPDFDHPRELRVLDPACGSGHFLLYAFDILERIWWEVAPEVPRTEVPARILQHNLFGVDLDLRACQLAAFSLYLKARTRAQDHGADAFKMPALGIVCADAHVADLDGSHAVFDEVAADNEALRATLDNIVAAFEQVEGLGSLLDVRGTLSELTDDYRAEHQFDIFDDAEALTLSDVLNRLHETVASHTSDSSFRARDLTSFLRLLVVLSQDYDVALMNPPYGRGGRMPNDVQDYVEDRYQFGTQFYINFFEVNERLAKPHGRIGMLVPKSFMHKTSYRNFRERFVQGNGAFDFLADFGKGILDRAAVNTAGTIVDLGRATDTDSAVMGRFFRLHDVPKEKKEATFLQAAYANAPNGGIQRRYERPLNEFNLIPGAPLSYWVPKDLRRLYSSQKCIEAREGDERISFAKVRQGLATGKDDRFLHFFWENTGKSWVPFSKGGEDSWILPRVQKTLLWGEKAREIKAYSGGNGTPSKQHYFKPAITYSTVKSKHGRRFGFLQEGSVFGHKGSVILPKENILGLLAYANSIVGTYFMLGQTPDRMWEVGEVSKLPWYDALADAELESASKKVITRLASLRQFQPTSPYYTAPVLLKLVGEGIPLESHVTHPYRAGIDPEAGTSLPKVPAATPLQEVAEAARSFQKETQQAIREGAEAINERVYDLLDVTEEQQTLIEQELSIRYGPPGLAPFWNEEDAEEDANVGELKTLVKQMLMHLAMEIVQADPDGIVPLQCLSYDDEEKDLCSRLVEEIESIWGEHANDRLAEIDNVLGSRTPDREPYPNLRYWLANKLFVFHCSEFENIPILWQLTTASFAHSRDTPGFACLVDYHQMGANLFDQLDGRYIGPRKSALRDRRDAARSRNDSEAAQMYRDRLTQIEKLEHALSTLSQPAPEEQPEAVQALTRGVAPTVKRLHDALHDRLETFEKLVETAPSKKELQDRYTDTFVDKVIENKDDWLDTLHDLHTAFKVLTDSDQPLQAHLYDLFSYYTDDTVGKLGYRTRNKILWMYHYLIDRAEAYSNYDDRELATLSDMEQLVARLGRTTHDEIRWAREVKEACTEVQKHLSSSWEERALNEVTAQGYQPVKKHGVVINIKPLSEQGIVPDYVHNHVL